MHVHLGRCMHNWLVAGLNLLYILMMVGMAMLGMRLMNVLLGLVMSVVEACVNDTSFVVFILKGPCENVHSQFAYYDGHKTNMLI